MCRGLDEHAQASRQHLGAHTHVIAHIRCMMQWGRLRRGGGGNTVALRRYACACWMRVGFVLALCVKCVCACACVCVCVCVCSQLPCMPPAPPPTALMTESLADGVDGVDVRAAAGCEAECASCDDPADVAEMRLWRALADCRLLVAWVSGASIWTRTRVRSTCKKEKKGGGDKERRCGGAWSEERG